MRKVVLKCNPKCLNDNQLTGSIPSNVGNLASLAKLHLYNNQLTGAIPSSIGDMASLTILDLSSNQLSGLIPPSIGNLRSLSQSQLYGNQLSGLFPTSLNASQTTLTSAACDISFRNSLCKISGQAFPLACSWDLSRLPLCAINIVITTTTSSPLTLATSGSQTSLSSGSPDNMLIVASAVVGSLLLVIMLMLIVYVVSLRGLLANFVKTEQESNPLILKQSIRMDTTNSKTVVDQGTMAQIQNFSMPGHLLLSFGYDVWAVKDLTKGGGGDIKLAEMKSSSSSDSDNVILKPMRTDNRMDEHTSKAMWQQEISILWSFHTHPNIARLLGYTENPLGMVLKLYLCSFHDSIHIPNDAHFRATFSFQGGSHIALGIARGMAALHAASVLHFDLNPHNILLELVDDKTYNAIITDFGISRLVGTPNVGGRMKAMVKGFSPFYSSPELFIILEDDNYTVTVADSIVDMYAFSIALLEILEKKIPWEGVGREVIKEKSNEESAQRYPRS